MAGEANTQNKILEIAEILCKRLGFRGYMHVKITADAEKGQLDRVLINLEAPNTERLAKFLPYKPFVEDLLRPLKRMEEVRQN